jgi:hypothetical protein
MVGNVLVVQVPCYHIHVSRVDEYVKKLMDDVFLPNKEAFGVEKIILLAKRAQ